MIHKYIIRSFCYVMAETISSMLCFFFQKPPELEFNAIYQAKIVEIR